MGFKYKKGLYNSGIALTGYIIGVAYINSVMPIPTTIDRSLYFVVKEETIIPVPIAIIAKTNITKGIKNNNS